MGAGCSSMNRAGACSCLARRSTWSGMVSSPTARSCSRRVSRVAVSSWLTAMVYSRFRWTGVGPPRWWRAITGRAPPRHPSETAHSRPGAMAPPGEPALATRRKGQWPHSMASSVMPGSNSVETAPTLCSMTRATVQLGRYSTAMNSSTTGMNSSTLRRISSGSKRMRTTFRRSSRSPRCRQSPSMTSSGPGLAGP